jgi:hypothetical protein
MTTFSCIDCECKFQNPPDFERALGIFQVPNPVRCPDCRELLRTAHINQIHLFKRVCEGTKKNIISNFPLDCPYPVYAQDYWYSDAVDNSSYGREFDFSRPFFEQFAELSKVVPRPALFTDYLKDENSSYTNYAGRNKNCYLIFDSDENWDCYYAQGINGCRSSLDLYRTDSLELCYQAIDSRKCYSCAFIQDCESCIDSYFLSNCTSCKNCIACCNLKHKEYYVFNEKVSPTKFEEIKSSLASLTSVKALAKQFEEFKSQFPKKALRGFQNENVSGNYLLNCKDAFECYDCRDLHTGSFNYNTFMQAKDCFDTHEVGEAELVYESIDIGYGVYNIRLSLNGLNQLSNLTYCDSCFIGCANLFGCVGLKRKQFSILNKEYSEVEYHKLVEKIISHMKETKEWGNFFPAALSPFPYNLTIANDYTPLTKNEALRRGFRWQDVDKKDYLAQTTKLEDNIGDVPDSITKETLACIECKKNYKIVSQELAAYKNLKLPVPDICWECRHKKRISKRSPRKLWKQDCKNCGVELRAAYDPAKGEKVFCDSCYLETLD